MSRIQNEIEHFSNLDHIWWGAKTPAGQKRYDFKFSEFKKYCNPKKGQKILEIGCGDGEFTRRLAKTKCKITATDITPKVVKKGKLMNKYKNVQFLVDNSEKMRFPGSSFDIVCGVSILHHTDYNKVIKEMYRVLKKDGQIFFTEPNFINPIIYTALSTKFLRRRMEFSDDETALVRWEMQKLLDKAKFRKIKVVNYDFLHPSTPPAFSAITKNLSNILEKTPLIKELSGSLIIWAQK